MYCEGYPREIIHGDIVFGNLTLWCTIGLIIKFKCL